MSLTIGMCTNVCRNTRTDCCADPVCAWSTNKFREGRVFVAGDAAHVHTPRGGQVQLGHAHI